MFRRTLLAVPLCTICFILTCAGAFAGVLSTPYQLGADAHGAATFSLPINSPPGTAGIAPSVAISYNSRGGNGLLGIGANISGVSVISRCARTRSQDNVQGSLNYDGDDGFCLDGQRMFVKSGVMGASETVYRTERADFSKIVSYDSATVISATGVTFKSPGWFKVWTKAGQIIEYGNTTDSNISVKNSKGYSVSRAWAMNKVADIKTNYMTVTYNKDATSGDFSPARMDYTGNVTATQAPDNSIRFEYVARPDPISVFQGPSLIRNENRLEHIKTYFGATLVRDYKLAYVQSPMTARSQLNTVTECDAKANCLPATTLKWLGQASGMSKERWVSYAGVVMSNPPPGVENGIPGAQVDYDKQMFVAADMNGDGRTDIVGIGPNNSGGGVQFMIHTSTGKTYIPKVAPLAGTSMPVGGTSTGTTVRWIAIDMSGDGGTDFLRIYRDKANWPIPAYLKVDYYDSSVFGTHDFTFRKGSNTFMDYIFDNRQYLTGDMDGDGREELVSVFMDYDANDINIRRVAIEVYKIDDATHTLVRSNSQRGSSMGLFGTDGQVFMADLNGDSLADIVVIRNDGGLASIDAYISDGTGFKFANWETKSGPFTANTKWFVGDVNGDGRSDVIAVYGENSLASADVHLNQGDKFSKQRWLTQKGAYADTQKWFIGDVNGDGRTDLINVYNDGGSATTDVRISTGTAFDYKQWELRSGGYSDTQTWLAADPKGLGTTALVNVFNDSGAVSIEVHAGAAPGDMLSSVVGGLGLEQKIKYLPLTDQTVYFYSPALYPNAPAVGPIYMVSSLIRPDGIGGELTTDYMYWMGYSDRLGRGLLGFSSISETQKETAVTTSTSYSTTWPFNGMVSGASTNAVVKGVKRQISSTSVEYGCNDFIPTDKTCTVAAGNSYFPYVSKTIQTGVDLVGTAMPTVTTTTTYDDFGNELEVKSTTKQGTQEYERTETHVYDNDTTNWFIGRPTRSTVTRTQP